MMFAENRKISIRQLQMLLLLDCFGTAVLFLPAELAEISGRGCFFAAKTMLPVPEIGRAHV